MPKPKKHHIDKRAAQVADSISTDDKALNTVDAASVLGCSVQFLESSRVRGFGPRYTRLSPRIIRYLKSDLIAWLRERAHQSTAEYDTGHT